MFDYLIKQCVQKTGYISKVIHSWGLLLYSDVVYYKSVFQNNNLTAGEFFNIK